LASGLDDNSIIKPKNQLVFGISQD